MRVLKPWPSLVAKFTITTWDQNSSKKNGQILMQQTIDICETVFKNNNNELADFRLKFLMEVSKKYGKMPQECPVAVVGGKIFFEGKTLKFLVFSGKLYGQKFLWNRL